MAEIISFGQPSLNFNKRGSGSFSAETTKKAEVETGKKSDLETTKPDDSLNAPSFS